MRKSLLLTASFLISATSAQAQILGGGAIGGGLGGTLGTATTATRSTDSARSTASSTMDASGRAAGTATADRRSGRATTTANGDAAASSTQSVMRRTPSSETTGTSRAATSASSSASADAQLIGTDQLRSTATAVRGTTAATSGRVQTTASSGIALSNSTAVMASTLPNRGLALSGSSASSVDGTFDLARGTTVYSREGKKIGKVRDVRTDIYGYVTAMLVKSGGEEAWLPAGNFSANGTMLVSAMSERQIKQTGETQGAQQDAQAESGRSEIRQAGDGERN